MGKRPFYRKIRRTLYETVSDSGNSVLRYRGHDDKEYYVASSNDPNIGPGGGMIEVTWQELKNKRDAGELIPGSLYRITDYNCTTTKANTQSAGHQFDIVLLALSENKLAEEGWAMMHDNIYDVTFNGGVVKKCYFNRINTNTYSLVDIETMLGISDMTDGEFTIDEENKTITTIDYAYTDLVTENVPYNYFQNSNLSAWKVWYCLDNDKSRFAWADDREGYLISGQSQLGIWDNQLILRAPGWDAHDIYGWEIVGTDFAIFTKTLDINVGQIQIYNGSGNLIGVATVSSAIKVYNGRGVIYRLIDEFNNDIKYDFKNIQFKRTITDGQYDVNGTETWCYTLNVWYNNMCQDASIVGNIFSDDENMVKGVYNNVIGYTTVYDTWYHTIHSFAFALGNNVILSMGEPHDYFGIYCNKIGDYSFNNTIDGSPYYNTIGNGFVNNIIGYSFIANSISNGFNGNNISGEFINNIISDGFSNNTIGLSFRNNEIGDSFRANIVGVQFASNETGRSIQNCHFGNQFYCNNLGNDILHVKINKNNVYYIRIEDGVQYVNITTSASGSGNLQNIIIGKGVKGESPRNPKDITHPTLNDTKQTTYLPTDSTTVNV